MADIQNTLPNYKFHHIPRSYSRGGGVAVLVRDGLHVRMKELSEFESMECMDVVVSSASTSFELVIVYRPPPSTENKLTTTLFFAELSSFMETVTVGSDNLLITGDFNVHVDEPEDPVSSRFLEILHMHHLQQHVTEPTHKKNHILDLLITRIDCNLVSKTCVQSGMPSDHFAVKCLINIKRPGPSVKRVLSRSIRKIDPTEFSNDVKSSLSSLPSNTDLNAMVNDFHSSLAKALDEHAPLTERSIILRPHAPWYSESLRAEKQKRRRRERVWRKSGLTVDKESYQEQCENYRLHLIKAKTDYHSNKISESSQRDLFRVVNKLSSPRNTNVVPEHENAKDLADSFAKFFSDKIDNLQNRLESTHLPPLTVSVTEKCNSSLKNFSEVSEEEVLKIIRSASVTSCPLDPLPRDLFKMCLSDIVPSITRIVNLSLTSGMFPDTLKHARVVPLLKKQGLDANNQSNYRPISNLAFTGKIIERMAVNQLQDYLTENNLHAPMQSAYRTHHSVETALLRVHNDILSALDVHKEALLVLLDFSAAFDTLDHDQLLHRITARYGIKDNVLQWCSSYLTGRTQSVSIGTASSDPIELKCGIPQGSVAGPITFILFSAPIQDIVAAHGIRCVVYADDTQLLTTFTHEDRESALRKMEACIADIRSWCKENKLALNDSKTEFMHFSSKFIESSWSPELKIGDSVIRPSKKVRNLGAIMDPHMEMSQHVTSVCRGALAGIRRIGQIRHYLDPASTTRLVHAFVTSKLDACNSLIFGLHDNDISKLQRVQNTAARLVLRAPRRNHITPLLGSLHWLPVKLRAIYKILLLTYKAIHSVSPVFIMDLIHVRVPSRSLRSSSECRLTVPRTRTKTYGDRTFEFAAADMWNKLPNDIRQSGTVNEFKSKLKTRLFRMHYL
jgi:hypothetical protein